MNIREWAKRALFRPAPAPGALTANRAVIWVCLAVAGVAVVLLRMGGDPLSFVWAEDGGIFLNQALNDSVYGAFVTTYAGYVHMVPRLLGELAAAPPLEWSSEMLALSGCAVTVLSAYAVWRASAGYIADPLLRAVLSLSLLFLPVFGFETLANVTYLQWIMFFAAFWLLLWRPPTRLAAAGSAVFVGLTVASAPLAVLLAPLAALRLYALRGLADRLIVAGFALGAIVQLVGIAAGHPTPFVPQSDPRWDFELLPAYLIRAVGGVAIGPDIEGAIWDVAPAALIALAAAAFVAVVAVAARPGANRPLAVLALASSLGLFLLSGYWRDATEPLMWAGEYTGSYGARYTILPALFLLTALLVRLSDAPRALRTGAVAVAAIAALTNFNAQNFGRSTVRWSDTLEAARQACQPGVQVASQVQVSLPDWRIDIPCSRL